MAENPISTAAVPFIKMAADNKNPEPGYFIQEDEKKQPVYSKPVHIPIAPNPKDYSETWDGYIKVEKTAKHYFRIDADDEMTLSIPEAKINITTGSGSLTTQTAEATLNQGFYYCKLIYKNNAYTPAEKSYEGCIALMSDTALPAPGNYVQYDTSKSTLAPGTAMKLLKIGVGCRIDWPEKEIKLKESITWYEMRQDANATKFRYNTGTISSISIEEFNQMARVIYAESATIGKEMQAIASVMLNRLGKTKGNAYRKPVVTMLTEFAERDSSGKNPNWASVTDAQYAKVEGDKYKDIDKASCKKLDEARKSLLAVLNGGPTVKYDGFRTGGTTPKPHETIGGTDFLTDPQYKTCRIKPDGWDEMPIWPGSPLNN